MDDSVVHAQTVVELSPVGETCFDDIVRDLTFWVGKLDDMLCDIQARLAEPPLGTSD